MVNNKNKYAISKCGAILIGIIFLMTIMLTSFAYAELSLNINAQLSGHNTDFYTETDASSNNGLDGNDYISSASLLPSNYSRFYSKLSDGTQLAIDSWNSTGAQRNITLVYETSPVVTEDVVFSWSFSSSEYDAELSYCGTDVTCASPTGTINMESVSTLTQNVGGSPRYFKLVISAQVTIITPYCGDGSCDASSGETCSSCSGDCGSCGGGGPVCTPSCPSASDISCGSSLGSDGCDGTCTGIGSLCGSGYICQNGSCVLIPECASDLDCNAGETCIDGNCEPIEECLANSDCGVDEVCQSGTCVLVEECTFNSDCGVDEVCTNGNCESILGCTPSSDCEGGEICQSGSCICNSESCMTEPPEEIPEDILLIGEEGCSSDFVCGNWGECDITYNFNDIINQKNITGIRKRFCSDKNSCYSGFEEKETCTLKEEVEVRTKTWCNQKYTEILKNGQIVARVQEESGGNAVNVNLNVGGEGYCAYCFDGQKNYDEAGIDCGGSCISCEEKTIAKEAKPKGILFRNVLPYLYPILILILLIALALLIKRTIKMLFKYEHYGGDDLRLLREYRKWKKQGYDVDVLENDVKTLAGGRKI